jgi:hypothetical protein
LAPLITLIFQFLLALNISFRFANMMCNKKKDHNTSHRLWKRIHFKNKKPSFWKRWNSPTLRVTHHKKAIFTVKYPESHTLTLRCLLKFSRHCGYKYLQVHRLSERSRNALHIRRLHKT